MLFRLFRADEAGTATVVPERVPKPQKLSWREANVREGLPTRSNLGMAETASRLDVLLITIVARASEFARQKVEGVRPALRCIAGLLKRLILRLCRLCSISY